MEGAIYYQASVQAVSPILVDRPKYRRDIDGLRAVAVALVVGFHAFTSTFPGGYIGVDVFFVISGFLISGIIIDDIGAGRFKFSNFYARRIKRIFPALIPMLLACYALGALLLLTNEFQDLCKFIASSAGFSANIALFRAESYFDTRSEFKPLLHMWSLGIEEQFYIMWPLALVITYRLKIAFKYLVICGFVLSFALNIVLVGIDMGAAFYLPFTRFFELMAGSGLACVGALRKPSEQPGTSTQELMIRNIASLLGIVMILAAEMTFSRSSAFPGWRALVPVAGAALVMAAGPQAWINRNLLAHPTLVGIGLISYPLYLWHWPLLSFLSITMVATSIWCRGAAVILAILLSWATYELIERPLRFGRFKWTVPALCAAVGVIGLAGVVLHYSSDFKLRGSADDMTQLGWIASDPECYGHLGINSATKPDSVFCYLPPPGTGEKVALLGDSMANSLYPGLRDLYRSRNIGVVHLGVGSCAPFRNLHGLLAWNQDCKSINDKIYARVIADRNITTVILGFSSWAVEGIGFQENRLAITVQEKLPLMAKQIDADIAYLRAHGKSVILTYDGIDLRVYPRQCAAGGACAVSVTEANSRVERYLEYWKSVLDHRTDVCIFHQAPVLKFNGQYLIRHNGRLAFRDPHHLSFYGSELMARAFAQSPCYSAAR